MVGVVGVDVGLEVVVEVLLVFVIEIGDLF